MMDRIPLQAALTFLDSWLDYRARQVDIPGFSVAIYHKDKIVFSHAYGLANVEHGTPLTTAHLFGAASQSKMFTATAILQLVGPDTLRLDDPVYNYLPWLAEHRDRRFREVTLRQLLGHRAGLLRDGLDADFWALTEPFPDAPGLRRMILDADLVFEPNTTLKYSNLGYALLGQVIEAASGKSYIDYVAESIIKPLKLANTYPDYVPELASRLATAYGVSYEHQRIPLEARLPTSALAASVGIHSTTEDMCQFAAAHFFGDERLISDQLKREMQRSQSIVTHGYDSGFEYGLGLEVQQISDRRVVGHSGHLAGYTTATFFDPYTKLAVTVMANCKGTPAVQMIRGIFETLDYFATNAGTPTPAQLSRFNVRACNALVSVQIVATTSQVVAIDPDDWEPFTWAEELRQVDGTTLVNASRCNVFSEGERIRFTFNGDAVQSVNYAGTALLPEAAYRRMLGARPSLGKRTK